jgi:hypothetical protein
MTKKDYIKLATVIRFELFNSDNNNESLRHVAEALAEMLQTDNPRFDRNRFLTACGFESPPEREFISVRNPIDDY